MKGRYYERFYFHGIYALLEPVDYVVITILFTPVMSCRMDGAVSILLLTTNLFFCGLQAQSVEWWRSGDEF
jgi:hypothetical protein